jgi:hypothetical protein
MHQQATGTTWRWTFEIKDRSTVLAQRFFRVLMIVVDANETKFYYSSNKQMSHKWYMNTRKQEALSSSNQRNSRTCVEG